MEFAVTHEDCDECFMCLVWARQNLPHTAAETVTVFNSYGDHSGAITRPPVIG